jgi:hypothetical protein
MGWRLRDDCHGPALSLGCRPSIARSGEGAIPFKPGREGLFSHALYAALPAVGNGSQKRGLTRG